MALSQDLEPKSDNSIRAVPIPEFVCEELVVKRNLYNHLLEINPDFKPLDYVCCNVMGRPMNRATISNLFRQLLDICGMPPMHFHDLRHTYSNFLKDSGVSLKAISMALGHSGEEFTKKVYLRPDHGQEVNDVLYAINPLAEELLVTVLPEEQEVCDFGFTDEMVSVYL